MTFAADGRTFASASADGKAKVWDVASGRLLAAFDLLRGTWSGLALSPDGRTLAAPWSGAPLIGTPDPGGPRVQLFDVPSARELAPVFVPVPKGAVPSSLTFDAGGRRLAVGDSWGSV
jgi:WD40 repeat protein